MIFYVKKLLFSLKFKMKKFRTKIPDFKFFFHKYSKMRFSPKQ